MGKIIEWFFEKGIQILIGSIVIIGIAGFIFNIIIGGAEEIAYLKSNHQKIDTVYNYDYIQFSKPDGTIVEGKIEKWSDYEGDQIQVKINDTWYLIDMHNAVMWTE